MRTRILCVSWMILDIPVYGAILLHLSGLVTLHGGSSGISTLRPKLRQATPRTTSYERDERLLSS